MTQINLVGPAPIHTPSTVFTPANVADGPALWRMYLPHLSIPRSKFIFSRQTNPLDYAGVDIVIVQRLHEERNFTAIEGLKNMGLRFIYDLDDNLWAIRPHNPAYQVFRRAAESVYKFMEQCQVITCSTRGLKTAIKTAYPHLSKPIFVTPNAIDFNYFQYPVVDKDDNQIHIGWTGSNTHSHDVMEVWEVVADLILKHEKIHFYATAVPDGYGNYNIQNIPQRIAKHPRVHKLPWIPVPQYVMALRSWSWDITLAPLETDRFNNSKSNIKILEAAAIGAVCLASDVNPYREFAELAGTQWLLCNAMFQWREKLELLITDLGTRMHWSNKMRAGAMTHYNMEQIKDNWLHAISEAGR